MHGLWQTNIPSRFLDELPEASVEVTESQGGFGGFAGYGASRFDAATAFGSSYNTPGWQRAQGRKGQGGFSEDGARYGADGEDTSHLSPAGRGRATADFIGGSEGEGTPASRPSAKPRIPLTIEGELIAKSTGTVSAFTLGDRVFHQKFGNGNVTAIDGNKLTIAFDRAGEKRVVDSFVERV
jgi:DNA helicase-2/ATP-dependent DNA helicase PcrA